MADEEYVLSDDEEESVVNIPMAGGALQGLMHADGTTKLDWAELTTPQRIVYVFDGISGLRFYLTGKVVDGYLQIQTELI